MFNPAVRIVLETSLAPARNPIARSETPAAASRKERLPVQCKNYNPLKITLPALAMLVLSGCGSQSVCADGDVLKTVRKLFDQQQFGQFIQGPPGIFVVQEKSATLTSTDKQGGKSFCSVLVQLDILEMSRFTGTSEADLAKMKTEAPKRGLPLTKDYLVNYTVQPMASGQNHVTVLP